jgi:hypothetical protein
MVWRFIERSVFPVRVADAGELFDRTRHQERVGLVFVQDGQTVGLHRLADELRQHAIGTEPAGDGESGRGADVVLEPPHRERQIAVQPLRAGQLAVGLVEIRFDVGREIAATREDVLGETAIDLGVAFEDDHLRAQPLRLAQPHARLEPEAPRLVRARSDHAGADDDRAALQRRVALLLDRGEERVDVDVEHDAIGGGEPCANRLARRGRAIRRHTVRTRWFHRVARPEPRGCRPIRAGGKG